MAISREFPACAPKIGPCEDRNHSHRGCDTHSDSQTYFTGPIAELLVYSHPLTADEQRRVRTYLYSKWGVR